jgi:hypothetical protein
VNLDYVIESLWFWETLSDETKKGDEKKAWKLQLRAELEAIDDEALAGLNEITRRRYEELEGARGSVSGRGTSLLLFVGVVSTGATLVGGSLESVSPVILGATLFDGALLLYACLAVAFLAIRAQEVTMWEVPRVDPTDATNKRSLAVTYAVELEAATQQNKLTLRNRVAYLADAQRWARRAVILVVVLAILSVAAAATKPSSTPSAPAVTPVPTLQPGEAAPSPT